MRLNWEILGLPANWLMRMIERGKLAEHLIILLLKLYLVLDILSPLIFGPLVLSFLE